MGSHGGTLFEIRQEEYEEVRFTLEGNGTTYKFRFVHALRGHAERIVERLHDVSRNPNLLQCPKCGIRFVHAKEPVAGQNWEPFLSCAGMMVEGKGKNRGITCDGVSKKLPTVVVYR